MKALIKLAYVFSPCSIATIFSGLGVIGSLFYIHKTAGWSFVWIFFLLPAMAILFFVDRLMKCFIKPVGKLWIYQTIFLLVAFGILYLVEI